MVVKKIYNAQVYSNYIKLFFDTNSSHSILTIFNTLSKGPASAINFREVCKQYTSDECTIVMATTRELIEQINRLFRENKMETFMYYLAEDIVWDMYTASSGHTTFNGTAEISKMDGSDMPEHTNFRFSTIVIEGDQASVQGSSTNKQADGTEYKSYFCDIYRFKDDKIVKITSYVVDNIK